MQDIKFEVIKKITETGFKFKNISNISKVDSNSPPSVFVGSGLKYPAVNVGILSPLDRDENAWLYDDMKYWADNNFAIQDVVKIRENLLSSRFRSKVYDSRTGSKFVEIAREIALASKPVDVEIELKNRLNFENKKDRILTPHGMSAVLSKAKVVSNVRINRKVEKVINDDLKASESLSYLYKNKISEYSLSKILSIGVIGLKTKKKLVPTRWAITATDDFLAKQLMENVKENKIIENHQLFFGEFMGNQYLIMLFPNTFNYELFELYFPGSAWNPSNELKASSDYETFFGRKDYARSTSGGYYATRFPIVEYLNNIKRQASVLVIRIETPGYWASLGVWVVRESVRKALERKMEFSTQEEFLKSVRMISKLKFNFDCEKILQRSKILNEFLKQKSLMGWF